MAKKRNHRSEPSSAYCAAWETEVAGGKRIAELAFGQNNPQQNIEDAIKKARYWFQYNWLVRNIILLRYAFFNFGFRVKAVNKSDKAAVDKWSSLKEVAAEIERYTRDAWMDLLICENVIGLWRKDGRPLVIPPEDCTYSDKFGIEILELNTQLTPEAVKKMPGLSPDERKILIQTGGKLKLSKQGILLPNGDTVGKGVFNFDVVKRERMGQGLAWPGMSTIFTSCAQLESMEVRDNVLAAAGRTVYEQHQIGHEIKSGPHAGSKANFYNDKKGKAVETSIKGKTGHVRMATNFDHKILYPGPDPAQYDAKKFESGKDRVALWGMPLAQMVLERSLNPYLMDVLRIQAIAERELINGHLETIMTSSLHAPKPVMAVWSNRCFKDTRTAADLMKAGVQWGWLSQQSAQEEAGYDTEEERERKSIESKLPKAETEPLVDANHGKDQKRPGKKTGTADRG